MCANLNGGHDLNLSLLAKWALTLFVALYYKLVTFCTISSYMLLLLGVTLLSGKVLCLLKTSSVLAPVIWWEMVSLLTYGRTPGFILFMAFDLVLKVSLWLDDSERLNSLTWYLESGKVTGVIGPSHCQYYFCHPFAVERQEG